MIRAVEMATKTVWVVLATALLSSFVAYISYFRDVDIGRTPRTFVSTNELSFAVSNNARLTYVVPTELAHARYENSSNCTVRVVTPLEDGRIPHTDNVKRPSCSWRVFDENLHRTGQFYGRGYWIADRKNSLLDFHPETCQFDDSFGYLGHCPHKNKTNILITGDSHSGLLYGSLLQKFKKSKYSCRTVKHKGRLAKSTYFSVPSVPRERLLDFSGDSIATRCDLRDDQRTVYLERLPLAHFAEVGLLVSPTLPKAYEQRAKFTVETYKLRAQTANSMVEYLLRYYFPHYGFPDLWILSPAFHHEAWDGTVDSLLVDFQHFLGLLDLYLPTKTQIVFMGNAPECVSKQPPVVRDWLKGLMKNSTINELLHGMNQMYYRLLRKELETHRHYHVFLDTMKISCPLTCEWHKDGAHFVALWYKRMIDYLLDAWCQSD